MRSYILTEAEHEALLRYVSGADAEATPIVRMALSRWGRWEAGLREDLELLRTAAEDRLPHTGKHAELGSS